MVIIPGRPCSQRLQPSFSSAAVWGDSWVDAAQPESKSEALSVITAASLSRLEAEQRRLTSNAYVEQQARDRLHMCLPTQTCYVIISPRRPAAQAASTRVPGLPWYERLWDSVQQANKTPAR